jgi:predicted metal-dependent phosphoesterase TrpH
VSNLVPEERALSVADLHIHTRFSDGADSPAEVVEHAHDRGLHVIAITDHDRIDGALIAARHSSLRAGVEVIVGEEVSSRDGHILGLFLKKRIAPGMSAADTVAAIHDQNGLAIAAHPYWRTRPRAYRQAPSGVGQQIAEVDFDAVEVINGGITPSMFVANMRAAWANERIGRSEIGGSDAHVKQAVGGAVTLFEGSSARALRKAIERGRTMARLRRPNAVALGRYIAWGLTPRPYPAREAV